MISSSFLLFNFIVTLTFSYFDFASSICRLIDCLIYILISCLLLVFIHAKLNSSTNFMLSFFLVSFGF